MFLPCRPCCGGVVDTCPDDMTVTLSNLPNENTSSDNYVTSNEGTFRLTKVYDAEVGSSLSLRRLCRWRYEDHDASAAASVILKLELEVAYYINTAKETTELTFTADNGVLVWYRDPVSGDPLNVTFANADVTGNSIPWALQSTMSAVVEAYTTASLEECKGYSPCDHWKTSSPTNPLCPPIMTVTDATDVANYCGTPAAIYRQTMPGTAPLHYADYYIGGTDTLDLSLPTAWSRDIYFSGTLLGTDSIDFGGGTYSMGWGGVDCVKLSYIPISPPNTAACGPWAVSPVRAEGWVAILPSVTVEFDRTPSGGSINSYNGIAVAEVNLVTGWSPNFVTTYSYPSRRIFFKIGFYYDAGDPSFPLNQCRSLLNWHFAFASDGTLGEDAYTVGSFPTFTESDGSDSNLTCPATTSTISFDTGPIFTIEQGV